MNRTPDYYATLGVSPTSEAIVIQAAYRALMRRYHPDTNSAPGAAARAQAINAAYAFLSDPTKRKQYDESRLSNDAKKAGAKNPPPPPSPPPHPKSAQTGKTDPVSSGDGSATWKVVAGFAGVLLLIAAISSNNDSNSNIMNVDETLDNYSMAAENLSAVADISLDAGSTVDAAAANADGSEFNLLESINTPTATLASLPLQPIRYGDIEEAANQFTKILFKGGIAMVVRSAARVMKR